MVYIIIYDPSVKQDGCSLSKIDVYKNQLIQGDYIIQYESV